MLSVRTETYCRFYWAANARAETSVNEPADKYVLIFYFVSARIAFSVFLCGMWIMLPEPRTETLLKHARTQVGLNV